MSCEGIDGFVSDEYRLGYLNHQEIRKLVTLLRDNDAIGSNLRNRSFENQVKEFEERAGRQLLVALHEATMGRPFEDILLDEFKHVHPQRAQSLYLTVCLLNRLDVPVRAGLVARVHGIAFTEFREELFDPLEHVVETQMDRATRDYMYVARHPEVAQIVFERVLTEATDKYHEYIRVLKHLNISFSSDRTAFRQLIRARALHELFPRYEDVRAIFEVAEDSAGREAFVYQQMANYERIRPNGNYLRAYELLQTARKLDSRDSSITHSLAVLARTQALNTNRPLERLKYRNEARSLLAPLLEASQPNSYARHTAVELAIDDLEDLLRDVDSTDEDIRDSIRRVERNIERGQQQFPDDHHLRIAESRFGRLLRDNARSRRALEAAFASNPRDPYIAIRLADLYEQEGDLESASNFIRKALDANRGNKELNFQYAWIRRAIDPIDVDTLVYHLGRAFTEGDQNYEAQFWYARYLFENPDIQKRQEAKAIFRRLRDVPMQPQARHRVRDQMTADGQPRQFIGTITKKEMEYGFATVDGRGDYVFFHKNNADDATWDRLRSRGRVRFNIGFAFGGPRALGIETI